MKSQDNSSAMPLIIQRDGKWNSLRDAIAEVGSAIGVKGIMVLACESNGEVPESFDEFLRALSVPVFGGIFPALIADGEYLEHGNIVLGLKSELNAYLLPTLSDTALNYDEWLKNTIPPETMLDAQTMFVFVDGFAPRVGELMESLFNTFGLQGNFIGGGAGSLTTPNSRCLITPQGVLRDAAILVLPKLHSQVSVAHGWLPISRPLEVTSSEGNVILTLDWEPALDVYLHIVESQAGSNIDFAAVAPVYPLGVARLNMEYVVRDLVEARQDGGLVCIVNVPTGSLVQVMNGNEDSLLAAASAVRAMADTHANPISSPSVDIVIDCISRSLYLGEKIHLELNTLHNNARPSIGAFTLGEIANSGQDCLEFHNKTVAVATLWD